MVHFLNQPVVKEGIKNIASTAAFTFGLIEAYDIYQILCGGVTSTEITRPDSQWMQMANKTALLSAKISLILSAATSRPGVFILSVLVRQIFSERQLEYAFGPNTIFAVNPRHPRHLISIAAAALALPSAIHSSFRALHLVDDQYTQNQRSQNGAEEKTPWLTDDKVHFMALFNLIASRPIQHLGNQIGSAYKR